MGAATAGGGGEGRSTTSAGVEVRQQTAIVAASKGHRSPSVERFIVSSLLIEAGLPLREAGLNLFFHGA